MRCEERDELHSLDNATQARSRCVFQVPVYAWLSQRNSVTGIGCFVISYLRYIVVGYGG